MNSIQMLKITSLTVLFMTSLISCGEEFDKPNLGKNKSTEISHQTPIRKQVDTIVAQPIKKKPEKKTRPAFAIVDKLRVRSSPDFNSSVISMLKEGEAVIFMGEKSTNIEEVELRGKKHIAPFLKIKLSNGKIGWAYGAALDFNKLDTISITD